MTKPRLFINMHYMELGGAERALLGLLNAIDTDKVDVDLFLNQHTGAFMPLIPSKINLLPEIPSYSAIERPIKTILKEVQEFKKASFATPVFMILEVIFETIIPIVMGIFTKWFQNWYPAWYAKKK